MLKHITVILQAYGMYELSILKTHGNHLIKAHEKLLWGSKTWAHGVGSGTTFHQQYVRGEETIKNLCN